MHLDRKRAGARLALALAAGGLAQGAEVVLPGDGVALCSLRAGGGQYVVDQHLEVHFGFAAEPLDVGQEVALVGADGTAERVVIFKGGAEPEGQNGGLREAARR